MATIDPKDRADFRSRAYCEQEEAWRMCEDIAEGTLRIREKKGAYLPKFEGEDPIDYEARIKMTFVNNHYAQALEDHVGLVFANPPKLSDDVPPALEELLENVDGEGTHFDVFQQEAMLLALDHGHVLILTDYPNVVPGSSLAEAREQELRPYLVMYTAKQAISWRIAKVGGITMLEQIVLEETFLDVDGLYGEREIKQYRTFKHEMTRNDKGVVIQRGAVTWALHERDPESPHGLTLIDEGVLLDPDGKDLPRIPIRIVYGGRKLGALRSKPHLLELAMTNIQETQVESDYAAVMHKCNVPTPIFVGRGKRKPGQAIQMGSGIDLPIGGSAMYLEPSGAALNATRNRLTDIRAQIQRQGGFVREAAKQMTATEIALYARQRNARLVRAVRSLQDGMEGALMDMALYMPELRGESGSISWSMDFGVGIDIQFVQLCLDAYEKGALPLEPTLHALKTGKLPEDFDPEDMALRMMVEATKSDPMTEDPADGEDPNSEDLADDAEGDEEDGVLPMRKPTTPPAKAPKRSPVVDDDDESEDDA